MYYSEYEYDYETVRKNYQRLTTVLALIGVSVGIILLIVFGTMFGFSEADIPLPVILCGWGGSLALIRFSAGKLNK